MAGVSPSGEAAARCPDSSSPRLSPVGAWRRAWQGWCWVVIPGADVPGWRRGEGLARGVSSLCCSAMACLPDVSRAGGSLRTSCARAFSRSCAEGAGWGWVTPCRGFAAGCCWKEAQSFVLALEGQPTKQPPNCCSPQD